MKKMLIMKFQMTSICFGIFAWWFNLSYLFGVIKW